MAATVVIHEVTGTAGASSNQDVTSVTTLHNLDDAYFAASPTYPITVPAASSTLGWWKSHRLNASTTPTTAINNLATYFDGTNSWPAGITMAAQAANVGTNAGYRQATATGGAGTTGDTLNTTNHTGLTGAPVEPFANWTAAAPKSLAGSISNPSTGQFGDFVVYQMAVASTVTATGTLATETATFTYDET